MAFHTEAGERSLIEDMGGPKEIDFGDEGLDHDALRKEKLKSALQNWRLAFNDLGNLLYDSSLRAIYPEENRCFSGTTVVLTAESMLRYTQFFRDNYPVDGPKYKMLSGILESAEKLAEELLRGTEGDK